MTISVRMDPLLEIELEQAARRQGLTKSQFIIDAVERALGRKDPGQLYHQVQEKFAEYDVEVKAPEAASVSARVKDKLKAAHLEDSARFAAAAPAKKKAPPRGGAR